MCVGDQVFQKLQNLRLFMVGCGAIGCEMLKNFAMLGVGAGSQGQVILTDNDNIEKSNLNRQFLFRNPDIGHPKSESAARAAKLMNPHLKIVAHLDKMGPDTETKYSNQFFEQVDVVVNALDNVNARLYMDSRCVVNQKPLLESGTLGPKGHVQVILPFQTESYGSTRDPPERDVPFCTLKSFPNLIEHCIEWARDFAFGGLFVSKPLQWNQLMDQENFLAKLTSPQGGGLDLKVVRTSAKLLKQKPRSYEDCIAFARLKFEAYFVNKSKQLLHNFPLDHKVDAQGSKRGIPLPWRLKLLIFIIILFLFYFFYNFIFVFYFIFLNYFLINLALFWTSPKRPPVELHFSWNEEMHRQFVISMANLWAEVWGVERENNLEKFEKVVMSVKVPEFRPKSKKIETDEKVKKEEANKTEVPAASFEEEIDINLRDLNHFFVSHSHALHKLRMKPLEFEKDDDTNFHVDFIAATANLRSRQYSIPEVDRLKVKAIAGRIMPAIATTTAAVSGLVSVELVKIVKGCKLEAFKNLFMNLALPFWALTEPGAAQKKPITDNISYTLWDRWDVKEGDITLEQFINYFHHKFNLVVGGVFKGAAMVYGNKQTNKKKKSF
jgi:ubiquitin-activating enzyme E1-like protein 2